MAVWNACKKSYPLTRPVATVWHLQKGVPRLHPPVNDAIGLCGQSGSKAHLTEEGTATAAPYSSDEISRHANRSELVDSALDFALQLLAFAFHRSEEHTSELQSLMRISYAVFCLKKKK